MTHSAPRTIGAGLLAGLAFSAAMVGLFRGVGFGWNGGGPLLNPSLQSPKLIAVWTSLEPLPKILAEPEAIFPWLLALGICHAFVYRWLSPSWPSGIGPRAIRFALLTFVLTFCFWELFTPYNLFGEPVAFVVVELAFWGLAALAESFVLALVLDSGQSGGER